MVSITTTKRKMAWQVGLFCWSAFVLSYQASETDIKHSLGQEGRHQVVGEVLQHGAEVKVGQRARHHRARRVAGVNVHRGRAGLTSNGEGAREAKRVWHAGKADAKHDLGVANGDAVEPKRLMPGRAHARIKLERVQREHDGGREEERLGVLVAHCGCQVHAKANGKVLWATNLCIQKGVSSV